MIGDASRFLHKIAGPFDVIFQDGDKRGYVAQLDRLYELLRPGGVLAADNVLWSGAVVPGMPAPADRNPDDTKALSEYNQRLKDDPRFHTVWLPVGDGVAISTRMPLS
jgi:caffeoyl-CoA O-methyltransferase